MSPDDKEIVGMLVTFLLPSDEVQALSFWDKIKPFGFEAPIFRDAENNRVAMKKCDVADAKYVSYLDKDHLEEPYLDLHDTMAAILFPMDVFMAQWLATPMLDFLEMLGDGDEDMNSECPSDLINKWGVLYKQAKLDKDTLAKMRKDPLSLKMDM